MLRQIVIAAIFFVLHVNPAQADIFDFCLDAVEKNEKERATLFATAILEMRDTVIPENRDAGAKCLAFATGAQYVYDPVSKSFTTPEIAEENQTVQSQKDAIAAKAAEIDAKIKEETEQQIAQARKEKEQSQLEVWTAVLDACKAVYFDEPAQAVTNRICLDVFLETGLPKGE
jgi:hypothetical protein